MRIKLNSQTHPPNTPLHPASQFKDIDLKQIYGPGNDPTGKGHYFMSCMATCVITLKDGTTRMDIGEGDGIMGNLHECVCKAKKQAFTDALKRAARKYGEFLGLGMAEDDGGKRNAPVSDAEVRRGAGEDISGI